MNKSAAIEYVTRLMNGSDEHAFHCLIEFPDEALAAINEVLQESDTEQFKRLVDVLRELRTAASFQILSGLCECGYSKKWRIAAEGLFYGNPSLATSVLKAHLARASGPGTKEKLSIIEEMTS
jgi:hypothetical protein